ncbi:MAG TPA: zinc-dependent metalloprotease family protein [Kiritimatiellia bacterium]|nr:zinc-dependent metalloprotease family protein [Kiritimatiellia bacterium]
MLFRLTLLFLTAGLVFPVLADERIPVLLPAGREMMPPEIMGRSSGVPARRQELARLNRSWFEVQVSGGEDLAGVGMEISLFGGEAWRLDVLSVKVRGPDRYTMVLEVAGRPHAHAFLTYEAGGFHGVIEDPREGRYLLQGLGHDVVEVVEVDPEQLKPCGGGVRGEPEPVSMGLTAEIVPFSTGTVTVDVAVVYTPSARVGAGGVGQVEAQIQNAIAQANLVMGNSQLDVAIRLVYLGEVDYVESGDMFTDLNRLTDTHDGFLDEVHCLRDLHGADLVQLITESGQFGGLAWIMCPSSIGPQFASQGFSVSRRIELSHYVLIHEFGHNFGCDHDPGNLSGCRAHGYSQGYRFINNNNLNKTVMAYDPGFTVGHFSNPNVNFFGTPTGNATQDNARTIRETAGIVAAFRSPATPQVPSVPMGVQVVPVQTNAVRVTWNAVCGATGYRVLRNGSLVGTTSSTTFTNSGLVPGSTHCWRVVATNGVGSSAQSGQVCTTLPLFPPFIMDGVADFGSYLQSSPGMTIYAAVRTSLLYVATWSTGIHPGDTTKNDHFIFVTDVLLPTASSPAPWAKSGNVAMNMSIKPFMGAESEGDFVGWFNAPAGSVATKAALNSGQMEGVIDVVQAFGFMPEVVYVASAAYQTQDGGGLVAQAPAGISSPNIAPSGFLALPMVAIRDEAGTGVYDRLDPDRDFVAYDLMKDAVGTRLVWASVPGQEYLVEAAVEPGGPWSVVTNLVAGPGAVFMNWTEPMGTGPSRVYRVSLP